MAGGDPLPHPQFSTLRSHPNRYRDTTTAAILTEAEAWLWDLTEIDADHAADPTSWNYPAESRAFALAAIEDADAELARRDRLRCHPSAPAWPGRWADRRAELDAIKAALPLPRFLEELCGVRLERRGRQLVGRCPLPGHDETTPSFFVHPEKGVAYCFGCHRGGDLFAIATHMTGGAFPEVVRSLAAKAGIAHDGRGVGNGR